MKTEHSAGGIILRKKNDAWQLFVIKDMSGNWTFPKGKIEKGETIEEASRREIYEETGITNLVFKAPLPPVYYTYKRKGIVQKIVDYILFVSYTNQPLVLQTEEGIQDAKWIDLKAAMDEIGYKESYALLITKVQQIAQIII